MFFWLLYFRVNPQQVYSPMQLLFGSQRKTTYPAEKRYVADTNNSRLVDLPGGGGYLINSWVKGCH